MVSSVTREKLGVKLLLFHIEKSRLKLPGESVSDASQMPPWSGVVGVSHQEETSGKTKDTLVELCVSGVVGVCWALMDELEEVTRAKMVSQSCPQELLDGWMV